MYLLYDPKNKRYIHRIVHKPHNHYFRCPDKESAKIYKTAAGAAKAAKSSIKYATERSYMLTNRLIVLDVNFAPDLAILFAMAPPGVMENIIGGPWRELKDIKREKKNPILKRLL